MVQYQLSLVIVGELAFIRLSVLERLEVSIGDDTHSNEIPTDGGFKFGQSSVNSIYVMLVTINTYHMQCSMFM